jgi:hypothetical protein
VAAREINHREVEMLLTLGEIFCDDCCEERDSNSLFRTVFSLSRVAIRLSFAVVVAKSTRAFICDSESGSICSGLSEDYK